MKITNLPKKCGIYQITCIPTGRKYVGSSKNILNRFNAHKRRLRLNKHDNSKLQRAYNKYGANSFKYSILLRCPVSYLIKLEQHLLYKYVNWEKDFNLNMIAVGGADIRSFMYSESQWKLIVLMINKGYTSAKIIKLLKKGSTHRLSKILNKSHYRQYPISKELKEKFNKNNIINKLNFKKKYPSSLLGKLKYLELKGFKKFQISKLFNIKFYEISYSKRYKSAHPIRFDISTVCDPVLIRISKKGKITKHYNLEEAVKVINHIYPDKNSKSIRKGIICCIKGTYKTAYGYKWKRL